MGALYSYKLMYFVLYSSALATPEFEGRGGEELGQHLAHQLTKAYSHTSTLDLESLCVIPGQQCWVLYVDVLVSVCTTLQYSYIASITK